MAEPAPLQVDDALEELVNQFSDPLSFLRELVQNALDAGSEEVEISVTWEADDEKTGVAIVHVDDFGEGMTREIIEKRLTRLFSSAKDGDKTKIGKFGIGFVSVFAIGPEAVCVDTSREGEHWRVLFDAARRFRLMRRDHPVDGTKIRIYKKMTKDELAPFVARARRVLTYWCKHTRGEVRFDGERINAPLHLDAPCQVTMDDGFSRVIVGHAPDHAPFFGFYNTGLTLEEGRDRYFDALAFKASSPHLEHTLTRDSVILDQGYHRVTETIAATVEGPLCAEVFARLEAHVGTGRQDAHLDYLYRAAAWHVRRFGADALASVGARNAFVAPSGRRLDVASMRRGHRCDEVLVAVMDTPLSQALEAEGATVVRGTLETPMAEVLRLVVPDDVSLKLIQHAYCRPLPPAVPESRDYARLAEAAHALLRAFGAKLSQTVLGHFAYEGSPIASQVAITQDEPFEVSPLAEVRTVGTGFFSARRALVINADHPAVHELVRLAATEPAVASYLLAKLFFVGTSLDADTDGRLAQLAMEARWPS